MFQQVKVFAGKLKVLQNPHSRKQILLQIILYLHNLKTDMCVDTHKHMHRWTNIKISKFKINLSFHYD